MLLAADIGNTNIVIGAFGKDGLARHWRIGTSSLRTADEYGLTIAGLISSAGIAAREIEASVICSVVPGLNKTLVDALRNYLGLKSLIVGDDIKPRMPVLTDNPAEVGADRVVNAVAAYSAIKAPLIVVDMGTAITFDYVTGAGEYAGGAIAPGVAISAEALFERTAKLPRVEASRPEHVVGRNTAEAMRSGLYHGFGGLIDGIIEKMKEEVKTDLKVAATGGFSHLAASASRHITVVDEFLTLKGLKIIYEGNG